MKKQVKKLSKKILVLGLATSIIFTTCFSHKKINAHATSIVAGLGAYTLYEICLYIGGLAVTTLGIGYAYENRDEIAEFGKSVIDSMSDLGSSWVLGSHSVDGDYVYGTEALEEVQNTQWAVIQGGGQSPKNDNDDDGDEDLDDRELELNLNGYFLTQAGVNLFKNHIQPMYENWKNNNVKDDGTLDSTFLDENFGFYNSPHYYGQIPEKVDGKYQYYMTFYSFDGNGNIDGIKEIHFENQYLCAGSTTGYKDCVKIWKKYSSTAIYEATPSELNTFTFSHVSMNTPGDYKLVDANFPIFKDKSTAEKYLKTNVVGEIWNNSKVYTHADWINENNDWQGHLEDIATSLRSLQDLTAIAQALSEGVLTTQPSADEYGDMMVNLGNEYVPKTDPISEPTYYPDTNTTPKLDPSVFPNYQPGVNPNPDPGTNPSPDDGDGGGSDEEIDLDGLGSIFSILFYLIMIIIMLIYLFLACLAFIVMIFRIPASSAMLPEEMVMGFDHLKTIMIPGMNISIYGFAMALIYLLIIFTVIKILRLEINDFKFPRAGRKP